MKKTISEIKEMLPKIEIEHNGKKYSGQILGRKMEYPIIYIKELDIQLEYSWKTVTNIYNKQHS